MNAHREINTHHDSHTLTAKHTCLLIYSHTCIETQTYTMPTPHTHRFIRYQHTMTPHTHTSRHGHHENMHMTCTTTPANGSSYHRQPFGKHYLILKNAPVRETLSQPKIPHDAVSVPTWQNRKNKNSMWARPLNSAVLKEQMWRDHTIPNYQWMKKLGFQLADGRPAASMNIREFIRVLQ